MNIRRDEEVEYEECNPYLKCFLDQMKRLSCDTRVSIPPFPRQFVVQNTGIHAISLPKERKI